MYKTILFLAILAAVTMGAASSRIKPTYHRYVQISTSFDVGSEKCVYPLTADSTFLINSYQDKGYHIVGFSHGTVLMEN